jgi:drug/metabolite transporter (DMT)-like permease
VAAAGFGTFYVFLDLAAADGGAAWAVLGARLTSIPLVALTALAAGVALRPPRAGVPLMAVTGLAEAAALVSFAAATRAGPVAIAAVLGSLYPLVTAGIAAVVLGERLTRAQLAGGALSLAGVAAIAAGRPRA